jgi:hypothetical protein
MTDDIRTLRAAAWLCLAFGAGAAVALWANVPQVVTTIETIGGHGTATFEGVERSWSGFFALMGGVALVSGAVLWALLRAVASIAQPRTTQEVGRTGR